MALSLHTDFALRVLIYLAGSQKRATVAEISDFFEISKDHVAKVVQRLARLRYIRSVRGAGGGLEIAMPADRITIGEVIVSMEGNMHLLECVAAEVKVCVIQPGCKLKSVLAKAERIQLDYLNGVKLSDVAAPGKDLVLLKT